MTALAVEVLGRGPERLIHVGVDHRDDPGGRFRAGGQRGPHLIEAFGAMGDVVRQGARRIVEHRPVPGQQHADVGDGLQPVQRAEVVTEVAVAGDDRRAAAEHRVPGEQRAVLGQQHAYRVCGVAG